MTLPHPLQAYAFPGADVVTLGGIESRSVTIDGETFDHPAVTVASAVTPEHAADLCRVANVHPALVDACQAVLGCFGNDTLWWRERMKTAMPAGESLGDVRGKVLADVKAALKAAVPPEAT